MSNTPPFRADHVGSLLRPDTIKQARIACLQEKTLDPSDLHQIENKAIVQAVQLQTDAGLLVVTDGEYRRQFWHYDFMAGLSGIELIRKDTGVQFAKHQLPPIHPSITDQLDFPSDHPMLEHFEYLASITNATPKISIPGPSCCHFRTAAEDIKPKRYQDLEVLLDDLTQTYKKAVHAFYNAGCRYLQLDDIFFAYLCDPEQRAKKQAEGFDPNYLVTAYAKMMHDAIADRPPDMLIGMHMCRGNFRSTHVATGAYDPVADAVFNQTGVDIFFMEYDTERAGSLEPLRQLAKGKQRVMPGFVTTKTAALESTDELQRKFELASKYADLDQLGIAPQCGFASTEEGNTISIDDQQRKLELVVKTAELIWGGINC